LRAAAPLARFGRSGDALPRRRLPRRRARRDRAARGRARVIYAQVKLLFAMPNRAYRADDFFAAAERAGAEVVVASDRCHVLDEKYRWPETSIVVDYKDPEGAAATIVAEAGRLDAVAGTEGETAALVAALGAAKLGLAAHPPSPAAPARHKLGMRRPLPPPPPPLPRLPPAPTPPPH